MSSECYLDFTLRFFCFKGPDEVVGPEGMEKFCEDIGVEPENVSFFHSAGITPKRMLDKV